MHVYYDLVCGLDVSQYLAKIILLNELPTKTEEDKLVFVKIKANNQNKMGSFGDVAMHVHKNKGDVKEKTEKEVEGNTHSLKLNKMSKVQLE